MDGILGCHIHRSKKREMVLSQTGLINRIVSVMDMENCNHKFTPADRIHVGKDVNWDPCMEECKYRAVVSMMLYLAGSTYPDITFVVHQCAIVYHNPKRSHEIALKHITYEGQVTKD